MTVRSTNHESSVAVMLSDATLHVTMAPPAVVTRETIGSLASAGKSERIRVIASRTSSSAAERSVPKRNSMLVVDAPSSTVDVICSMPAIVATASSTLRVISDSICVGATPPIRDRDDDGRKLDVGAIENAELRKADESRGGQRNE